MRDTIGSCVNDTPLALPARYQNHLLAALPADVQNRLSPHLEVVQLPLGQVVYEPGEVMRQAYFPIDAIVSWLGVLKSGVSVEVSMVGNEGLVGIASCVGDGSTPLRAVVHCAGFAYGLLAQRLKDEFDRHGGMLILLLHFTQALMTQMAQTAVCNRCHTIEQQLCRWLLLSLDRLPGNRLNMTQELLGNLLGVRREGINDAAGRLHELGVIKYKRGHITVLDRPKLATLSCECYAMIKEANDRLLPSVPPR